MAVLERHLAREHCAHGAVDVPHFGLDDHRLALLDRRPRLADQFVIERGVEPMILRLAVMRMHLRADLRPVKELRQIQPVRLPMVHRPPHVEAIGPTDHLVDGAEAHCRHDLPHLLRDEEEVVDHVLRLARELRAQDGVLSRDTDRAGVQVALAHHDAAERDQRRRREAELVRSEKRTDHHVPPGPQAAIDLNGDATAQVVQHQGLMRLGEADLPRAARMRERSERRSAGPALEAGDRHMVGLRLRHAGRDRADAYF